MKRIFIYALMAAVVCVVVPLITLYMLGYHLDADNRNIRQYAFLQFGSVPSGATVSVDGAVTSSNTPSKTSVPAGKHNVIMWRNGYEKWQKSVNLKPGTLTWLNYILLIPKDLELQSTSKYPAISYSLASPKGGYMLIQPKANEAKFDLVDLGSDKAKTTSLELPASFYASSPGGVFKPEKWSDNERYVLLTYKYAGRQEWIVMDTQDLSQSKNITKVFDLTLKNVNFAGSGGSSLYALDDDDIRKLDLSADTISRPLVSNVADYSVYNKLKIITYTGTDKIDKNKRVAGIYRDGDKSPAVIKTISGSAGTPIHIATANYFNENYVALSYGKKVEVFSGSYPNTTSDSSNNMKVVETFNAKSDVGRLSFSPTGKYVFIQSNAYFASYDLEYRNLAESTVAIGDKKALPIKWLDDNHIWSDGNGKLIIREFDGSNSHDINAVIEGQDATLTSNGRFLYSLGRQKSGSGYQLQRVRMILP